MALAEKGKIVPRPSAMQREFIRLQTLNRLGIYTLDGKPLNEHKCARLQKERNRVASMVWSGDADRLYFEALERAIVWRWELGLE